MSINIKGHFYLYGWWDKNTAHLDTESREGLVWQQIDVKNPHAQEIEI